MYDHMNGSITLLNYTFAAGRQHRSDPGYGFSEAEFPNIIDDFPYVENVGEER